MSKSIIKIALIGLTPSLLVLVFGYEINYLYLIIVTIVAMTFLIGLSIAFTYIEWRCYRRTEKFKEYDFKDYIKERGIM